jgi:putative DNA primase/helicase
MEFTIFTSKTAHNAKNCIYPTERKITSKQELVEALRFDQVFAKYDNNYRSVDGFLWADVIPQDCDNDDSDDPETWETAESLHQRFISFKHVIVPSRNNLKPKNGKTPRPKNHIFFPVYRIGDSKEYEEKKALIQQSYPFFDGNAIDAARFFFASECKPEDVIWHDAEKTILDVLEEYDAFENLPDNYKDLTINEGSRNATMSKYAAKILKKYGDTDEAYKAFLEVADKCNPPLEKEELDTIWNSGKKFLKKIEASPDYIPPEKYNDKNSYKPADYTDVGQATVLAKYFKDVLRYCPATHFLCYRDTYWEESDIGAQAVVHELTRRQLLEANQEIMASKKEMESNGAQTLIDGNGKKSLAEMDDAQLEAYERYMSAVAYKKFVLGRRESRYISACLKEVKPMVEISTKDLDSDPFLLCTPNATYDLRKGMAGAMPHDPNNFITKITAVSPSDKGKKIWLDCLNKIFAKNPELIDYVQLVCGLAAIGKVMIEGLIIAFGDGGNGKSTFWNAIFRTMGLYSGKISADTLTTSCRRNTKPEMAEAKGKRLLIASESEQGARLDESMVKQLCSTDAVQAEKKYKDPFHFVPCHTLVLHTNYLPRVSGIEDGIWDRLFVIPFNNKLRGGDDDVKNYADYLYENAGEYILTWIIEGAKKVIDLKYKLPLPQVVKDAISDYREQNNWFNHFIDDCCEKDKKAYVSSNQLYSTYRRYSIENGEYVRSTNDFYSTLKKCGYKRGTEKRVRVVYGLRLAVNNDAFEDFLT